MAVTVGRPPIGPKAQTNIPEAQHSQIEKEASKRGIRTAEVLREVIAAGLAARTKQVER